MFSVAPEGSGAGGAGRQPLFSQPGASPRLSGAPCQSQVATPHLGKARHAWWVEASTTKQAPFQRWEDLGCGPCPCNPPNAKNKKSNGERQASNPGR